MSDTTMTVDEQASIQAQNRLTEMPPQLAEATREAMYRDGYLQDFGDGDMKTFNPFDSMEPEFYWLRVAYVKSALEALSSEETK